jgi:hypothetical protein
MKLSSRGNDHDVRLGLDDHFVQIRKQRRHVESFSQRVRPLFDEITQPNNLRPGMSLIPPAG